MKKKSKDKKKNKQHNELFVRGEINVNLIISKPTAVAVQSETKPSKPLFKNETEMKQCLQRIRQQVDQEVARTQAQQGVQKWNRD